MYKESVCWRKLTDFSLSYERLFAVVIMITTDIIFYYQYQVYM